MKTLSILLLSIVSLNAQPSNYPLSIPPPSPVQSGSTRLTGSGGSSTYSYYVVAVYPVGNAQPSIPIVIFNAPASLTMSNFITVTWQPIQGVTSYTLLRYPGNTHPPLPITCSACLVSSGITSNTFVNNSNTLTAYTLNTTPGAKVSLQMTNGPDATPTLDIYSPTNQVITVECISPVTGPVCGGGGGGGNPMGGVGAFQFEGSPTTFAGNNMLFIGDVITGHSAFGGAMLDVFPPFGLSSVIMGVSQDENLTDPNLSATGMTIFPNFHATIDNFGQTTGLAVFPTTDTSMMAHNGGSGLTGIGTEPQFLGIGTFGPLYGFQSIPVFAPSDGTSDGSIIYGVYSAPTSMTTGNVATIYGIDLLNSISGITNNNYGAWAKLQCSACTITNNQGFYVATPQLFGGGTFTFNAAYFNQNQTGIAGAGADFAWYSQGGTNHLETGEAGTVGVEIERHTGQTADLFVLLQEDGTTPLAHFDKDGILTIPTTVITGSSFTFNGTTCSIVATVVTCT